MSTNLERFEVCGKLTPFECSHTFNHLQVRSRNHLVPSSVIGIAPRKSRIFSVSCRTMEELFDVVVHFGRIQGHCITGLRTLIACTARQRAPQ